MNAEIEAKLKKARREEAITRLRTFLTSWYEQVDPRVVAPLQSSTLVSNHTGKTWRELVEEFVEATQ